MSERLCSYTPERLCDYTLERLSGYARVHLQRGCT